MRIALNGVFNIDKAAGITSMEVVRAVKRLTLQKHVGHGGTLDPIATGVLPVCLGQATRLMQYMVEGEKEYVGTIHLGIQTDTYDAEGRVTDQSDPGDVTLSAIETALESFRGAIQQTPPMYSALKQGGKRLYKLARSGIEVQREPRTVEIKRLEIAEWKPPYLALSIVCSRGMYIRSLAHDLGQSLGCGAHLAQLRRIKTGAFHLDDAITLQGLKEAFEHGDWEQYLRPSDCAVRHLGTVSMTAEEELLISNGQPAPLSPSTHFAQHMETRRAYNTRGVFVGLLRFNKPVRLWQPYKMFRLDTPSPYMTDATTALR